jgi:CubicO group peptidase (beta-lactamase class C family)
MLPNPASAQDVVNALTDLQNDRVEIIYNHAKAVSNNTQISIAFIENGLTNYYGIIKEDEILKSIENKDKLFEIGSITKVFTATLLANAVLDNKIGLEDDISKFYDFPFRDSVRIDFLSLANHTSALESIPSNLDISDFLASQTKAVQQNPYQTYGEKDLEAYLKNEIKLGYMHQKQYNYSNFGMGLLGYTLSLLSNSSYERLISNEIFEKYNMTNSHTNIDHAKTSLVKGISEDGSFANNWLWDSDVIIGAGGILSTVTDLSKFACAQFDFANRELALTRIPTFTINEKMKVGLGWHIIDNGDNRVLYWHNGGTGGYSSSMILDVKEKKGIIILSNVSVFHPEMNKIDSMCFQLMNAIK